jgi:hypothetical protein
VSYKKPNGVFLRNNKLFERITLGIPMKEEEEGRAQQVHGGLHVYTTADP